jgi:hypothetical protein
MQNQMQRGEKGVNGGIEIFVPPGRKINQRNAAIAWLGMPLAAVNRNAMPALSQPGGKFFGEGLEAAIAGRDSTRTENRDARFPTAAC